MRHGAIFPAMDYLNDTTMLCLAVALILGGVALGYRVGALAALWCAGGAWLALRFADRLWRPVFTEMRERDQGLDFEFWLPWSYGLLFAGLFGAVLAWTAWVKPRPREFTLPGRAGPVLSVTSGIIVGALLLLAVAQSQVMSATGEKRMPRTLELARPVLDALGQEHLTAPARPAGATAPGAGR